MLDYHFMKASEEDVHTHVRTRTRIMQDLSNEDKSNIRAL